MPAPHLVDTPLATGTVTFLFTDIEGSTRLWEEEPERMRPALARHDAISRTAVESHRGLVVKSTGDGVHAAFDDARDALVAAVDLQQALTDPATTNGVALRVRCGLHTGLVEHRDNDFFGPTLNRAARIMSAAHGGQVLLSQVVVDGVRDRLPAAVSLRDLGRVRLKDLATPEHVYQVVHPDLRLEFPALRSLEATPNNLPQQATSFIGREKELAELKRLLAGTRLVTLTGSGGCGKTRLSLQVAADSLERFPDGVWLVELAALADAGLVVQTVSSVLGLKEEPGKPLVHTLGAHLKDRRLLLLLDNCEHLLDGCAALADTLVRQCPHLTMLASSREALGIGGEQAYRVPSLSLPDPKQAQTPAAVAPFESVRLFTERALLARPDFRVTNQNAATLASICNRLDGIPLAIELAAARVRSLSVEELNRKLDERFRILTGGSRTALPRQQTLRSLIDWSYDLLHEPEKLLLQRLSVFVGGWTLAAAEPVCAGEGVAVAEVLDLMTSLVDKSLVVVDQNSEPYRYRLLETVRQYARERLLESGSSEAVRERHRDCFLALAEEAESKLTGTEQAAWLRRLEGEHDNLRSALESSLVVAGEGTGLRLCGALQRFWRTRGHISEGREWCARVLGKVEVEDQTPERAKVLNNAGILAFYQSDLLAARAQHEECLAIRRRLGDRSGIAGSLLNLGNVARGQGDYPAARAFIEESLAIERELGNRRGVARSLNNLGNVVLDQGGYALAQELHLETLAIWRELGDLGDTGSSLINLGLLAYYQGDYPAAKGLNQEALAIMRELGNRRRIAGLLNNLGSVVREEGDLAAARGLYSESLMICRELGDRRGIADALDGLASVVAALCSSLHAARMWGAAERLREEIGSPLAPIERQHYDRRVAVARTTLGDDAAFDRARQEGRALTLEQAIELAMDETLERP
jgi:predicted ATPase/class 3 adenylate cyclase